MVTKSTFSNQLLEDIRCGKREAVKILYEKAFHYATSFILKNSGSMEEAREAFQEALFVLIKNSKKEDFKITHDIRTYLFSACRNLWLKELRDRKSTPLVSINENERKPIIDTGEEALLEKVNLEKKHLELEKCMANLSPENRQLLQLTFFEKLGDKEIAPRMGISFKFVRQKRRRCIAMLRKCMEA